MLERLRPVSAMTMGRRINASSGRFDMSRVFIAYPRILLVLTFEHYQRVEAIGLLFLRGFFLYGISNSNKNTFHFMVNFTSY